MAGDTTVGENYAFAGMHHIFDQHTAPGRTAGHWTVVSVQRKSSRTQPYACNMSPSTAKWELCGHSPYKANFCQSEVKVSNEVSLYVIHLNIFSIFFYYCLKLSVFKKVTF